MKINTFISSQRTSPAAAPVNCALINLFKNLFKNVFQSNNSLSLLTYKQTFYIVLSRKNMFLTSENIII